MNRPGPLAGIRILDLTRLLPGPVATLHLADLGADVIKIEDPQVGDYARTLGTGQGADSAYFRMINRNKRGLLLDLKKPAGVEVFMRLAATADVIVESFRPGVVDKLGVGYAAVAAVNPKIAYCSISGYGQDGPYKDLAGHDINYLGYAGVLDQIGREGGDPALPNFQIADLLGGALTAAMGILAAVLDAQRSGRGRYIDVAMTDSVLAHTYFSMLRLNDAGHSAAARQRPAFRRPALLCHLSLRRWPAHGGRGARRQVLEDVLRASWPAGVDRTAMGCRLAIRGGRAVRDATTR